MTQGWKTTLPRKSLHITITTKKSTHDHSHGVRGRWNFLTTRAGVQEMLMAGKTEATQAPLSLRCKERRRMSLVKDTSA
jgi:hypothetical protein